MRRLSILMILPLIFWCSFFACSEKKSSVVAPNNQPETGLISATPGNIILSGNPREDTFSLTYSGNQFYYGYSTFEWHIVSWPGWLSVSDTSGFFTSRPTRIQIAVDFSRLSPGENTGIIKVTSPVGDVNISVTINNDPPELKVVNNVLNFDRFYSQADVDIRNTGGFELSWSVLSKPAWIKMKPSGKIASREFVPVSVDWTSLAYGEYTGEIIIEANEKREAIHVYFLFERAVEVFAGIGAAQVELGKPFSYVKQKLGIPSQEGFQKVYRKVYQFFANYPEKGVYLKFKETTIILSDRSQYKVKEMFLREPFDGMTPDSLRIGSTIGLVNFYYGEPDSIDQEQRLLIFDTLGISFIYNQDSTLIEGINIFNHDLFLDETEY